VKACAMGRLRVSGNAFPAEPNEHQSIDET
jgi:hypothetical protein